MCNVDVLHALDYVLRSSVNFWLECMFDAFIESITCSLDWIESDQFPFTTRRRDDSSAWLLFSQICNKSRQLTVEPWTALNCAAGICRAALKLCQFKSYFSVMRQFHGISVNLYGFLQWVIFPLVFHVDVHFGFMHPDLFEYMRIFVETRVSTLRGRAAQSRTSCFFFFFYSFIFYGVIG